MMVDDIITDEGVPWSTISEKGQTPWSCSMNGHGWASSVPLFWVRERLLKVWDNKPPSGRGVMNKRCVAPNDGAQGSLALPPTSADRGGGSSDMTQPTSSPGVK